MQARFSAAAVALILAAPVMQGAASPAERNARSRHSSAGSAERHSAPGARAGGRSAAGSRSRHRAAAAQRRGGRPAAVARPRSGAQSRQPRPGTGTGYHGRGGSYGSRGHYGGHYGGSYWGRYGYRHHRLRYGHGYYSRHRHYPPYYYGSVGLGFSVGGLGLGFSYARPYGYGYYPVYGGYGYAAPVASHVSYVAPAYSGAAEMRVMVDPADTKVFVDGQLAGVADDFDGMFQRLYLEPGRRELRFERDGYRTHGVVIDVAPGASVKLRHSMEQGAGTATTDDRTGGTAPPEYARREPPAAASTGVTSSERDRRYRRATSAAVAPALLRLRVSPGDASVYVDGEFRGTGDGLYGLDMELSAGSHRVEVVRPGYAPFRRDLLIEGSEPRDLEVELERP